VVIWADPTVPNRHQALLEGGPDPTPWLEHGVQRLMECGAEILVVPCNTIHAYMPAVVRGKDVEFVSIIDATVSAVTRAGPRGRVGLLAADGALASELYQSALRDAGMEPVVPPTPSQRTLMQVVYSVKAGAAGPQERQQLLSLVAELRATGVATVIAGCTEVSTLLAGLDVDDIIDPSQVLALQTVERARSARW
jgi:aspartate racemase